MKNRNSSSTPAQKRGAKIGLLLVGVLLLVMSLMFMTGCMRWADETSAVMTEPAVVDDVVFAPSRHGSDVSPTINMNGKIGFAITSVNVPEKYAVVFRCQHGKFIVEGTDAQHKRLWEKMVEGQSVTVSYREKYRVTYEDDKEIERVLTGYNFLDAVRIEVEGDVAAAEPLSGEK